MELAQKKGPPKNRQRRSGQHNGHIQPDPQTQQKSNHGADDRTGHPEGKPDEKKQSDDAVFLDLVLVNFGGLLDSLKYVLEPVDYQ